MPKKNKKEIPIPALSRLLGVYRLLDTYKQEKITSVSSTELGKRLGAKPDSIRKDVSFLGEIGNYGGGYDVDKLKAHIREKHDLDKQRNLCVVGLGRLGTAVLHYSDFPERGFNIVAGFDSNINKLETIQTKIELYPAYEITDVVRRKKIDMGIITVPEKSAQETADRLIDGGVRGIINFSPAVLRMRPNVFIKNIDLLGECGLLSIIIESNFI